MAIKTKHTFPNTANSTTSAFTGHGIELNNQDDLNVYVTLLGGTRVLQHRQATASTTDSNHEQVNDTTGLYFPSVATGVTLYNYTLSTDFNTITFNSNLPLNTSVSVERRTRDSSSNYTNFTSGGSIRSTELNSAFDESNFTAQEARNKAFDLENKLFHSDFTPYSDNTIDLGSSTKEWKDLYVDGTGYIDAIDAGTITASSLVTLNGHTNIGSSTTDTVTIKAKVDNDFLPNANGTYDLGASGAEWQDLWVTGTGNIDTIIADTATINGNLVVTGTISDSGGNLELAPDVNISGHLRLPDDKKLYLGNGDDAYIDWDTDGWFDRLEITSTGAIKTTAGDGQYHAWYIGSTFVSQWLNDRVEFRIPVQPHADDTVDLGASNKEWKDLYVDGTGYIDTVSADDITGSAIVTSGASTSDTKVYSAKRAGEIFYEKSTVDDITSGDTWVGDDNKLATTAAIDARIIDIVDDVGGFVPILNETSFPNANPDVNNGAGTLVSLTLNSNLVSNGSGVATIANGTLGGSTVTIDGLANSTTYLATFGMIVETTTTLNTYTFHRYVPKATEVTTVAGNIANVNTVAGNNSNINTVAGISGNVTTVAGIASNVTTVANDGTDIGTVAGISSNVTTVAGISANVTTVAGNNTNISTCATNISAINGASTHATNAATSATNAATSATNAASSATTASTQATNAASSATSAASSATTATTQASSASTSAANALAYRNTTLTYRNDVSAILTQVESSPYNLADNVSSHTAWGDITDTGANAVFTNESSNTLLTMSEGSSNYNYGSIT